MTGVAANRQTVSRWDGEGRLVAGDVNLTTLNTGVEFSYYVTPKVAVGALMAYQRQSATASGNRTLFFLSGGYYGPFAQWRWPIGVRSAFVLTGSNGGIQITRRNLTGDDATGGGTQAIGRYWLAGGSISLVVAERASMDFGLRYQSSTFTGATPADGKVTSAGLLVGVGLSMYLR